MKNILNTFAILSGLCVSSYVQAQVRDEWLSFVDNNNAQYQEIEVEALLSSSIDNSYKVNQIKEDIISQSFNQAATEYYYLPKVTLSSEVKQKFDRPGHPSPVMTEFLINLSASLKLWSNTTNSANLAELKKLDSKRYDLNAAILDVYTTTIRNLVKIEISRSFLDRSEMYKEKMNELLNQMEMSASSGLIKKSDRVFAEVTMKKFEESIININSQIEGYKSEINNLTAKNLYNNKIGLNEHEVNDFFELEDSKFDINSVINKNYDIIARKLKLESDKYSSKSLNETLTFELITQHDINEHELSSEKNEDNVAENGYTYDNDGESYIGLKLTFTGFDYNKYTSNKSEEHNLAKKMIEVDEMIHQVYVDLDTQKQRYILTKERLFNIDNQIKLTVELVDSLLKEIAVDESNVLDLFRNISSLSDLETNRLNIRQELTGIVSNVREVNSVIPNVYIGN